MMTLYRLDYAILSVLENESVVTMSNAITITEITEKVIKKNPLFAERFKLKSTVTSRLNKLEENGYVMKGIGINKLKTTWFITYRGIELVKKLEGETNKDEAI